MTLVFAGIQLVITRVEPRENPQAAEQALQRASLRHQLEQEAHLAHLRSFVTEGPRV